MSIHYGIIGAGMMGREHIQNIMLLENTDVVALVEIDAEQQKLSLELAQNASLYTNHHDAIKDTNIDAWVIASPNYTHIHILESLLKNDTRPILVEKPLCTRYQDCNIIEELAECYASPIWVAMEYRYMQAIMNLRSKVDKGLIGHPRMMSIREHRFPFLKKVGNWNRFSENTGGTLVEKCCHFFDLMRLLLQDEAVYVYASGSMDINFLDESYDGKSPDIIDNAYVIINFASGKRAMLDLCMFCDGSYYQEELSIQGELGKIECKIPGPDRLWAVESLDDLGHSTGFTGEHRNSQVIFSPRKPKKPIIEVVKVDEKLQLAGDHHGSTFYQHKKFYDVINKNAKVEISIEDGLKSVKIGLAAEQSIKEKKVIDLKKNLF